MSIGRGYSQAIVREETASSAGIGLAKDLTSCLWCETFFFFLLRLTYLILQSYYLLPWCLGCYKCPYNLTPLKRDDR